MTKLDTLMETYARTVGRRIFRKRTVPERAGRFLVETATPSQALTCALLAGDQDAAVVLADAFVACDVACVRAQPPAAMSGTLHCGHRPEAA